MAFLTAFRLNPHQPAFVAALAGVLAALATALVPIALVEAAVLASGLPALLPAAEPPLGFTARAALMLVAGAGAGGGLWMLLQRLDALRPRSAQEAIILPSVRREDAHPDAPPRPPVRAARDLGEPMLGKPLRAAVPEVRPLPADLDVPLAAFDAAAIPAVPAEPIRPVSPLFRAPDPKPVAVEPDTKPAEPVRPVPPLFRAPDPKPVVADADAVPAEPIHPLRPSFRAPDPKSVELKAEAMPGERLDVFPLPNPGRDDDTSIDALLARFERGIARRKSAPNAEPQPALQPAPLRRTPPPAPQSGEGLESTLAALRRMAARA